MLRKTPATEDEEAAGDQEKGGELGGERKEDCENRGGPYQGG